MNARQKGNHNEHRSMALLEAAGYYCIRSSLSAGIFDIVGIGKTDLVLVGFLTEQVTTLLNTGSATFSPTSPLMFSRQLIGTTSAPQTVTIGPKESKAVNFVFNATAGGD